MVEVDENEYNAYVAALIAPQTEELTSCGMVKTFHKVLGEKKAIKTYHQAADKYKYEVYKLI